MSALLASLLSTSLPAFNPLMKWFKRDKRMILTSSLVEKWKNCGENYTLLHNFLFIKCSLHAWSLAKSEHAGVRVFIFELWRTPTPPTLPPGGKIKNYLLNCGFKQTLEKSKKMAPFSDILISRKLQEQMFQSLTVNSPSKGDGFLILSACYKKTQNKHCTLWRKQLYFVLLITLWIHSK